MSLAERQKNNFDFLRLVAALCVTFAHSFNYSFPKFTEPLDTLTNGKLNFSYLGLCTFFSLSGYLIAKSVHSSSSLKHFFWKRLLRIQPLLIVVCLATVFLLGPLFTTLTLGEYFSSIHTWTYLRTVFPLTGVQFTLPGVFTGYRETGVNGSLWTLVVEERLYLFIALIFFLTKIGKQTWFALTALTNLYFIITLVAPKLAVVPVNYLTLFFILLFMNAASLYEMQINFQKNHFKLIGAALLFYVPSFLNPKLVFLQVLFLPVLVISIAYIKGWLNKAGKYGDFSYAIYVTSFPVQQMLCSIKILKENPYLQFSCTVAIVLPLAVLSWHFIEKKMLAYKTLFA